MNILIVNDDGIEAKGLAIMTKAAANFGSVYIAGPHDEKSAQSQSITIKGPITVHPTESRLGVVEGLSVEGTPVDALRIALKVFDVEFDLVISGINHGANLAYDVSYSATVACAFEAALHKIPALAFSADDIHSPYIYDETVKLLDEILTTKLYTSAQVLNINFPKATFQKSLGTKVTILGKRQYHTEFIKMAGTNKYNLSSSTTYFVEKENTDVYAFEHGCVSITPLQIDRTDLTAIKKIKI